MQILMATKSVLVRLTSQNHPGGQRRRAGVLVLVEPTTVEVSDEQLEALKADPYITILRDGETAQSGDDDNDDDGKGTGGDVEDPNKGLERKTKAQLTEILRDELKQLPGQDFNPEATNPALVALIVELRAKAAEGDDDNDDDGDDSDDDGQGGGQ